MDNYKEKNNKTGEEKENKNISHGETQNKPKVCVTKEDLITHIKEWIKIDNDITNLKTQVKEKTNKKKELTETLVNVMKNNSIDCFDINGGSLIYKQKKTKRSISANFLLSQLEEYYKEQPELAREITKKVLDNRIQVVKDEITRKIEKQK
jgi:hypothetical protein